MPTLGRTLTIIAIALAVATTTISVTMSVYFSTTAKATPVAPPSPSPSASPSATPTVAPAAPPQLRDYWTQAHSKVQLPSAAKRGEQVLTVLLPPGGWVLHADLTISSKGPSDFVGCVIGDADTPSLNAHRTIVGNPTLKGNVGPAPLVTVISETAAVTLTANTRVFVECEHDTARGAAPVIEPGADLWAHQSRYLIRQGA
jgi:hypothetical protein